MMRQTRRWTRGAFVVTAVVAIIIFLLFGERASDQGHSELFILNAGSGALVNRIGALEEQISALKRRFWLEDLDPLFHYRSKYLLGKADDVEDKSQVIPFFLANFVDAASYPRRIYIDLGIKDFDSSLCWMMQHYPVKFDHIYGFECANDFSNVAALAPDVQQCIKGTTAESIGYKDVQDVLSSMSIYHHYVGLGDDATTSPSTKGLARFLQDVGIREEDFVVMKMDIEGMEYDLIERMLSDSSYKLVDELFVEIHYNHPEMAAWGWNTFPRSLSDAQALFTRARDAGMFIHPWP